MSALKQIFSLQYGSEPKTGPGHRLERPAVKAQRQTLERCLLDEFYASSKLLVAFTSILNARAAARRLQSLASVAAFITPEPVIFPAVVAGAAATLDRADLMANLQEFYARMSFARAFGPSAFDTSEGQDANISFELRQLIDVWQRVCSAANVVCHQLYDIENGAVQSRREQLVSIHEMIKSVQHGGSPCVRLDGTVFVPGWLDERRQPRQPRGWPVWLEVANTCEAAILKDVSTGGLGLESCQARAIGTAIKVHLPSNRVLHAVVTWSQAGRLGAKFSQPLLLDDPVLTGADQSQHVELEPLKSGRYHA